ncbi:MAG: hypothetical protein EBR59_04030 [Methylococcaceae bacterium]|jgi:hypothetical protein|nr:hypothetical protein [Methylococcaceae bacterium]
MDIKMKVFKYASALVIFASALVMVSPSVYAQDAQAASSASAVSSIVTNLESTLVEVTKSDFAAATIKVKAARNSAETLADTSPAFKKAYASLIQAQIQVKNGNVEKATTELNKVIALYKAL